jgi:hypothetical protein
MASNHARARRGPPSGTKKVEGVSRDESLPPNVVQLVAKYPHPSTKPSEVSPDLSTPPGTSSKKQKKGGGAAVKLPELVFPTYVCVVCEKPINDTNLGEPSLVYGADPGVTTWAHIVGCRYTLKANNEVAAKKAYDAYVERQHALGNYEV